MQKYKFNSLYVSVEDMNRAISFYEKLFGKKVRKKDDRYSEFSFGKLSFGLYSSKYDGVKVEYGANCVPNFEIENTEEEYKRIKEFAPTIDDEIMKLPQMSLFQFKDTEGNIIEVYAFNK
ncbi:MAG: lactoylglutathione lyase [Actinomycetia bacterium]|nr:lactoylglutathione lyase [Actinomycetes bacterium]